MTIEKLCIECKSCYGGKDLKCKQGYPCITESSKATWCDDFAPADDNIKENFPFKRYGEEYKTYQAHTPGLDDLARASAKKKYIIGVLSK